MQTCCPGDREYHPAMGTHRGTPDVNAQQTISDLQAHLAAAEAKIATGANPPAGSDSASTPARSARPIEAALRGQPPPQEPAFDPATLLVIQPNTTTDQWFIDNPVPKLTQAQLNTWLKNITMDPTKRKVLEKNLVKAEDWWNQQPDTAYRTIERAAVNLGVPAQCIPKSTDKHTEWHVLIKILTTAIYSWRIDSVPLYVVGCHTNSSYNTCHLFIP